MSLKVTAINGVSVLATLGPENEQLNAASTDGQSQVFDLGALGPRGGMPMVTVKFRSPAGTETQVEVPINALPPDRRRGWAELAHGASDVLAYHVLEEKSDGVVLIPRQEMHNWMSYVPDSVNLAELCIPGTHESTALHGYYISKCQTVDAAQQLKDGIRFLDVRIKVHENELATYHGIRPEHSTLREQIDMAEAFLRANPSEAVIVSVKEEGEGHREFATRVYQEFRKNDNGALWRFVDGIPSLGECRGKGIIFTRFNKEDGCPAEHWAEGMGLHPAGWPDDREEGFKKEGNFAGRDFRCHDWYGVPDVSAIATKASRVAEYLEPTLAPSNPQPLTMVFNSGAKFPLATPQWVSRGVGATSIGLGTEGTNARLTGWILRRAQEHRRPRAIVNLDYYQDNSGASGLVPLLVAVNFI